MPETSMSVKVHNHGVPQHRVGVERLRPSNILHKEAMHSLHTQKTHALREFFVYRNIFIDAMLYNISI